MKEHRPDRDALTGFLDGTLSIDARQWMEQHLESCEVCKEALEREKAFLERLDSIRCIEPPADFTNGVMARVAQQPAFEPTATKVASWPRATAIAAVGVGVFLVVFAVAAWALVGAGLFSGEDTSGLLKDTIVVAAERGGFLVSFLPPLIEDARALGNGLVTVAMGLFNKAASAGWQVQLVLLLLTVSLNYVLTRMVLNYQRRQ